MPGKFVMPPIAEEVAPQEPPCTHARAPSAGPPTTIHGVSVERIELTLCVVMVAMCFLCIFVGHLCVTMHKAGVDVHAAAAHLGGMHAAASSTATELAAAHLGGLHAAANSTATELAALRELSGLVAHMRMELALQRQTIEFVAPFVFVAGIFYVFHTLVAMYNQVCKACRNVDK